MNHNWQEGDRTEKYFLGILSDVRFAGNLEIRRLQKERWARTPELP